MARFFIVATLSLAAASIVACSGGSSTAPSRTPTSVSGEAGTPHRTPAAAPSPSPAAAATAEVCAGRTLDAIPRQRVPGEVAVNADGDAVPDLLYTLPFPEHAREDLPSSVHVVLDGRGGVGIVLTVRNVPVVPLGGFDVNGDGRDELFVNTGLGAYTTWIDVFEFDPAACTLNRLAAPGGTVPQFAVGASVGNGAGLACSDGKLVSTRFSRISDEPLRYRATTTTYAIAGAALTVARTSESELDADAASRSATFACGSLRLPGRR